MESARIGRVANSPLEIHLKAQLQVTSEMVDSIPQLPTPDPWVVAIKNTQTGAWSNVQTFSDTGAFETVFKNAEDHFLTLCSNNGLGHAVQLQAGKPDDPAAGREVRQPP